MTCGYVLRGGIWGRRRPLCVRALGAGGQVTHGRARTEAPEGRAFMPRSVPFWPLTCGVQVAFSLSSPLRQLASGVGKVDAGREMLGLTAGDGTELLGARRATTAAAAAITATTPTASSPASACRRPRLFRGSGTWARRSRRYWLRAAGIGEDVIGGRASLMANDDECRNFHRSARTLPATRGHAGHISRHYNTAGHSLTSRLCRVPGGRGELDAGVDLVPDLCFAFGNNGTALDLALSERFCQRCLPRCRRLLLCAKIPALTTAFSRPWFLGGA